MKSIIFSFNELKSKPELLDGVKYNETLWVRCDGCGKDCQKLKKSVSEALRKNNESIYCTSKCYSSTTVVKKEYNCSYCSEIVMRCPAQLSSSGNVFCNSSCAAKFNNANRTAESREKQRRTLVDTLEREYFSESSTKQLSGHKIGAKYREKYDKNPNYCSVCKITPLSYKDRNRKTCSKECLSTRLKLHGTNNLRKRRAKGEDFSFRRKSKLEQKFEDFLIEKGILNGKNGYLTEVYAKSPYNKTGYYRLDFVIPKKKLVIEVDGKQHEAPKQMKHDIMRDFAIQERGWRVIRVNYYAINKIEILEQIYKQELEGIV